MLCLLQVALSRGSSTAPTVSTSSIQAEYQAILRGEMKELRLPFSKPTPFFLDSQSAEDLEINPVYHNRSKHVAIKYHSVREHVNLEGKLKTAQLIQVRPGDQSADIYTYLTGPIFVKHRAATT